MKPTELGHATIAPRVIEAVDEAGASDLVDALTRSEADRSAPIGRLALSDDATWFAELLTDLEIDEVARVLLIASLTATATDNE